MKKATVTVGMLVVGLLLGMPAPGQADIIFERLGGGTGNNVLFNCSGNAECEAENANNNNVLWGNVQNTDHFVEFTANTNIQPGAAGQATIVPVDGNWTQLDVEWLTFDSTDRVIVRVVPEETDTTITLYAYDNFGTYFEQEFFSLNPPAGDFFRIRTEQGQLITSWGLSTDKNLAAVQQVRIGNLQDGEDIVVVAEPAMLALFGVGLLAGARGVRRRLRQAA